MSTDYTKRAISAGLGIGALALLAPRASADTPFTAYPFPSTGAPTPRTMPDRLADIVNVRDWGAKGDGATDDRAAIQAAFDAAFGTPASPNGSNGRYRNRAVYFPNGNYLVSGPLYLIGVYGAHIFGAGAASTKLTYTGPMNGQTVVGNGITALIMTNGFAYSRMEGLHLSIANSNSTCMYIFQDGTKGQTNGNTFADMLFDGATAGVLIGYQSNALCSENLFINCSAISCAGYGFRIIGSNALNNNFVSCGASSCGVGFSCPTGGMHISCASLAVNNIDITTGQQPITIHATRSESARFIDMSASQTRAIISGCNQAAGAGAGYFVNLASGNVAIIDACVQESALSTEGRITGSSGSKVYLRGNDFRNTGYLTGFTGTIAQNI